MTSDIHICIYSLDQFNNRRHIQLSLEIRRKTVATKINLRFDCSTALYGLKEYAKCDPCRYRQKSTTAPPTINPAHKRQWLIVSHDRNWSEIDRRHALGDRHSCTWRKRMPEVNNNMSPDTDKATANWKWLDIYRMEASVSGWEFDFAALES